MKVGALTSASRDPQTFGQGKGTVPIWAAGDPAAADRLLKADRRPQFVPSRPAKRISTPSPIDISTSIRVAPFQSPLFTSRGNHTIPIQPLESQIISYTTRHTPNKMTRAQQTISIALLVSSVRLVHTVVVPSKPDRQPTRMSQEPEIPEYRLEKLTKDNRRTSPST